MPTPRPSTICPKCSSQMEFGLMLDSQGRGDGAGLRQQGERITEWIRGAPSKRSWWTLAFKAKPGDRLQIATLRCTACGFLELYAPSESGSKE